MDMWVSITNGREALGDYLAGLTVDDWSKPSPCAVWTVEDTAAHMLVIPALAKGQVVRAFVGSGFNLEKRNTKLIAKLTATLSTAEIVARTRA